MTDTDLLAYQDEIARATKDLHARCAVEVNVLWDGGRFGMVTGTHKVRIWNGLGSVELEITHDNLVARGEAYRHFLDRAAAAAHQKLALV
jgi:hypothetical protein